MKLLQKILSTLPVAQRLAVDATLAELERRGAIRREQSLAKRRDLLSKVGENPKGPTFLPTEVVADTRVSSAGWNGMQERLYTDLSALYLEIGSLGTQFAERGTLSHSNFIRTRVALLKIIEQLSVYQFLRAHPQYQDVRFMSFLDTVNEATRRPKALIDTDVHRLELPVRRRNRLQQENLNLRKTTVTATHLGGGLAGGFSSEFGPEKMLDNNHDTFWGELVLADAVVRQDYQASWGLYRAQGVLGEVVVHLNNAERANNFRLLPFGQFPVRVVDLAYKANVNDETWVTIPGWEMGSPTLDWIEIDTVPVHLAALKITIEQPNYIKSLYHVPRRVAENIALWEQILDKEFDRIIHQVALTDPELAEIDADPDALAHINALNIVSGEMEKRTLNLRRGQLFDTENTEIQELGKVVAKTDPSKRTDIQEPVDGTIVGEEPDKIEISKLEYAYGIRSLEVGYRLYEIFAHYASPKQYPGSTVLEIELDTTETHPQFDDEFGEFPRTSIEYEVEIGENRRYPILPDQMDGRVDAEYLVFDRRTRQANPRFPMDSVAATIWKNGERLLSSTYTVTLDGNAVATVEITDQNAWDANAIYTMRYNALASASLIDLKSVPSVPLLDPEVFEKTDQNHRIRVNYYPYVEYEIISNDDTWSKPDSDIAKWSFFPDVANVANDFTGERATVTRGSQTVTLDGTTDTFLSLVGDTGVYFRVRDSSTFYAASVDDDNTLTLTEAYRDTSLTGVDWELGKGFETDGVVYALDQNVYEPVEIFVNDEKAENLTRYEDFENPAFIPGEPGRRRQFIHAGRDIYFSAPIADAKIEVYYRWRTQYLRLNALLRSDIPVLTEVTPKLIDYTLKLKTTKL